MLPPMNSYTSSSPTKSSFSPARAAYDADGKVINSINLSTEYEQLIQQPWVYGGMKLKIEQIKHLWTDCP